MERDALDGGARVGYPVCSENCAQKWIDRSPKTPFKQAVFGGKSWPKED